MKNIKNIIFDLDGTLIDSSEGVVEAVNYSLQQMGQPAQPPEAIKRFIGYPLRDMYAHFNDVSYDELHRHFQIKAAETIVASTIILPGVQEVLYHLKGGGYRLAIATTKIRKHVELIVRKFHWEDIFTTWTGGDEVPNVKPAPDIMLLSLERLQANPSETIVVGDTENDILAAKTVPLKVIAVESPYDANHHLLTTKPDYFIQSITELPELIGSYREH